MTFSLDTLMYVFAFGAQFYLGFKRKDIRGALIIAALFSVYGVVSSDPLFPIAVKTATFLTLFALFAATYWAGRLIGGRKQAE